MSNIYIADKLNEISELYTIKPDKRRATTYSRAASVIAESDTQINSGADAQKLKGVGKSVAADIDYYLKTGSVPRETELRLSLGEKIKVIDLFIGVFDIGPVKANKYYEKGYTTLAQLYQDPELSDSQRFGIIYYEHLKERIPREEIDIIKAKISGILSALEEAYHAAGYSGDLEWEIVGSYRRGSPYSGDVDILVKDNLVPLSIIVDTLSLNNIIVANLKLGLVKYLGILRLNENYNARRIDITMVAADNWTYAKLHATGSKNLNILMRQKAISMGLTLNEMGLFDGSGQRHYATDERQIFDYLGLEYIEPINRSI